MSRFLIAIVCALSLIASAAIAKEFSSVEEQMTTSQFKAAGLAKLSPDELAALNAWIRNNRPAASAPVVYDRAADDNARVGFVDSPVRQDISSNIVGEFNGFHKGYIFNLENGQVWQVNNDVELVGIKTMTSPRVTIRPGLIDGWRLQVEGYNTEAKVKRIK